ncbi:hypothetical protein APR04_004864 [Promicromonospora umidemergens]|nr:hypothetical protein [Promicromonospora umidemergens]MCP2285928.1 hypothetical protein [Promicromonospora umidemergens]
MTSSNAIAESAPVADVPVEKAPEAVDGGPTTPSPFELLPTGESFGVCDVDGVCS